MTDKPPQWAINLTKAMMSEAYIREAAAIYSLPESFVQSLLRTSEHSAARNTGDDKNCAY